MYGAKCYRNMPVNANHAVILRNKLLPDQVKAEGSLRELGQRCILQWGGYGKSTSQAPVAVVDTDGTSGCASHGR